MQDTQLSISRIIRAPRESVFEAWTTPDLLTKWWGPPGVECPEAEIDLREGGEYRIANKHTDGSVIWISGVFERVTPPDALVYSWNLGIPGADGSRVTVEFRAHEQGTEVTVVHERLAPGARDMHREGWTGCLEGLKGLFDVG